MNPGGRVPHGRAAVAGSETRELAGVSPSRTQATRAHHSSWLLCLRSRSPGSKALFLIVPVLTPLVNKLWIGVKPLRFFEDISKAR